MNNIFYRILLSTILYFFIQISQALPSVPVMAGSYIYLYFIKAQPTKANCSYPKETGYFNLGKNIVYTYATMPPACLQSSPSGACVLSCIPVQLISASSQKVVATNPSYAQKLGNTLTSWLAQQTSPPGRYIFVPAKSM